MPTHWIWLLCMLFPFIYNGSSSLSLLYFFFSSCHLFVEELVPMPRDLIRFRFNYFWQKSSDVLLYMFYGTNQDARNVWWS